MRSIIGSNVDSTSGSFGGVTLAARGSWPVARGEVEGVHHKLRATGYKPSFLLVQKKGQDLGRLGPVSSTRRRAYTSGLSTRWSTGVLTWSTQWEVSSWGGLPA